jgi:peptidoglycan/LPS O-acetylase OafA/YrhL
MSYRADIDGLRAIAVLSVVIFHLGVPGFSGGYIGVDVFFVISGYLITSILKYKIEDGNLLLVDFYSRRIRRLLPALISTVVASTLAAAFLFTPYDMIAFHALQLLLSFHYPI